MVRNKTLVLVVAVLAVGLFVMPSALSLFAGQHTFTTVSEIDCTKCHQAEAGELAASGSVTHEGSGQIHGDKNCQYCHQSVGYFEDTDTGQHASVSLPCRSCHANVEIELLNAKESHTEFYQAAMNSSIEAEGNEACISCHTMMGVDIEWTRATTLGFTANHDPVTGDWIIGDFTATGTNETTTSGGGYE